MAIVVDTCSLVMIAKNYLPLDKDPQKRASILSLAIHRTERNTTTKQRGIIRIPM